jgi:hypothetical protein
MSSSAYHKQVNRLPCMVEKLIDIVLPESPEPAFHNFETQPVTS